MAQSRTTRRVVTKTATKVIANAVIKGLAAGGALTTALVAPNALVLVDKYLKHLDKRDARKTIVYLKYRKLIKIEQKNGQLYYKLTEKGQKRYKRISLEEMNIETPKRWDGKWRFVMFDIPVGMDEQRGELLDSLKHLNFTMLQRSVWVHPFDCEEQVGVLLDTFSLDNYISFMVVERGNFTEQLTRHFQKHKLLI